MWIGDFVRCHSVVKLLNARYPRRPVDMLATTLCAPLADYMPGLRQAIVADLPRSRLALSEQIALAKRLKRQGYGSALVMPRTWKSTLAPFFAGIPERTGFAGEARFVLLNDVRFGERALPRMVDRCAALALPAGAKLPPDWPLPELKVSRQEIEAWRQKRGLNTDNRPDCGAGAGCGRTFETLAKRSLYGAFPSSPGRRPCGLGAGRARRKAARRRDRRRHCGTRSDWPRSARCHPGACRRQCGGLERFRPPPRRRGARHAVGRDIRPDQPVALGAAEPVGRDYRDDDRALLPALP